MIELSRTCTRSGTLMNCAGSHTSPSSANQFKCASEYQSSKRSTQRGDQEIGCLCGSHIVMTLLAELLFRRT